MWLFLKFTKKRPCLGCVWKRCTFRYSDWFAYFGQIQFYFQKQPFADKGWGWGGGRGARYCCFRKFAFRNLLSENCCFCLLPPLQKAPVIAAIAKLFQTTSSRNLISIYANLLQHFIFAHFLLTEGYGKCALRKEPFVAPSVERFKTATLRKVDR